MKVLCREHGLVPWEGHVECERCRVAYLYVASPDYCSCGVRLRPKLLTGDNTFSARCICARCFAARLSALSAAERPTPP